MGFWAWLRSLWPSHQGDAGAEDASDANREDDTDAASDAQGPPDATESEAAHPGDEVGRRILAGIIDDYNAQSQIGLVTLHDGAVIGFGREACEGFMPLLGLRVAIHGTGIPPASATQDPQDPKDADDLPGLWASRIILWPGSESEYAARLRIHQVERALRGAGERTADPAPGEPPWARGKNRPGRKPSGPGRPTDAFFVLTVVLDDELAKDAAALSKLIDPPPAPPSRDTAPASPSDPQAISGPQGGAATNEQDPPATVRHGGVWQRPSVRIIPLVRNKQSEPGFSAELQSAGHRAFMLYRPQPYGDDECRGKAHVGLFVGGPNSPRVAAKLSDRNAQAPVAVTHDAARVLGDLARALLLAYPTAPGVVLNRADKAFKPRDIALSQLGEVPGESLPFVFWIDWNRGERGGQPCLLSSGLEILALPDIAVALPSPESSDAATADDAIEARARDVLLYVCDRLLRAELPNEASTIAIPRSIRLQPASHLAVDDQDGSDLYEITARSSDWIDLRKARSAD